MKWKTLAASAFLIVMGAIPAASQTLTVSVTGTGKVTGAGIDCGSDCSETFPPVQNISVGRSTRPIPSRSRAVVLTAAGQYMTATGPVWGGACQGAFGPTCALTVPADGAIVSVGFKMVPPTGPTSPYTGLSQSGLSEGAPPLVSSILQEGPGVISRSPPGPGTLGTVVTYRADPRPGASFVGWSGVCTGSTPVCTHTFSPSFHLVASFGWPLTVTIEGAPGGRVIGKGINCPTVCTVAVPSMLNLEAIGAIQPGGDRVVFREWEADCKTSGGVTSGARCDLQLTSPTSVSARFTKIPVL